MNEDELREQLSNAPVPPPVGGHDDSRERMMNRVRQAFPADASLPRPMKSVWWRNSRTTAGAALIMAGLAAAAFFWWPTPKQDHLPNDAVLFQLYDQHQSNHDLHLAETPEAG